MSVNIANFIHGSSGLPLVTAIVVNYNQSRWVIETLESVKQQTYPHVELIVVDDCSTDDSVPIIETWLARNYPAARFLRHDRNQGVCRSLNDALAFAKGKYISEIAADDIWLPEKISALVSYIESFPEKVGVVYADAFLMDESSKEVPGMFIARHRPDIQSPPSGDIHDLLWDGNFIPAQSALIRRSVYERVGTYDESLSLEDWDMWLRISRHFHFAFHPKPLARYRLSASSMSGSTAGRAGMVKASRQMLVKHLLQGAIPRRLRHRAAGILCDHALEEYRAGGPRSRGLMWKAFRHRPGAKLFFLAASCQLGLPYAFLRRTVGRSVEARLGN